MKEAKAGRTVRATQSAHIVAWRWAGAAVGGGGQVTALCGRIGGRHNAARTGNGGLPDGTGQRRRQVRSPQASWPPVEAFS
jgi:hypothetical protein